MDPGDSQWRKILGVVLAALAALAAASALFFGFYGVQIIAYVVTYEGEGSLGHVGAWIAAGLFPLLALVGLALAWISGAAARRKLRR